MTAHEACQRIKGILEHPVSGEDRGLTLFQIGQWVDEVLDDEPGIEYGLEEGEIE